MNNELFESFLRSSAGRRATTLMRTHARSVREIFDEVLREVAFAIPFLKVGIKYTTAQLSKPESWPDWFIAERRVAGMCLAFFVREKIVGLVQHRTRSGKGTNRYHIPSTYAMTGKSSPRRTTIFAFPEGMV